MTREELIAALERAEGPSRELDAAVALAVGGGSPVDLAYVLTDIEGTLGPPRYTASLDAALTLVPLQWDWCVACINGKWDAQVGEANTFMSEGAASNGSPAIALCIAALKARS